MAEEWKIPTFVQTPEPEEEIKNILILALSTIGNKNGVISETSVFCDINGKELSGEKYHYQLEPIPIMLTQCGCMIDEVIMICTPETCQKTGNRNEVYPKMTLQRSDGDIVLSSADGQDGISARDYFAYFLKRSLTKWGQEREPYIYEVDYPASDDEASQSRIIGQIISEVRKHPEADIYIDTHGGPRAYQEVVNSVLSMLRAEGINVSPDNMYSVKFDNGTCTIVSAGLSMRILDFVSGMNELMSYGRVDTLNKFMESFEVSAEDRALIDTVGKIAAGMQLCMIPEYEKNLDELTRLLEARDRKSVNGNLLLDTFINNIRNNYRGLLREDRTVVDEIRWCLEKGFYQQVLTLIESRMAWYLHEENLFRYGEEIKKIGEKECGSYELNNYIFNNTVWHMINSGKKLKIFDGVSVDPGKGPDHFSYLRIVNEVHGETAKKFLQMHCGMKELRNIANHASGKKTVSMSREKFEQSVREYLSWLEEMKRLASVSGQEEYIIVKRFDVDVAVCSADGSESWSDKMTEDIKKYGAFMRIGPDGISPGDSVEDIRKKAENTVLKIMNVGPCIAVMDIWEKELSGQKEEFWGYIIEELERDNIEVFYVTYKFSKKRGKKKPVREYIGISEQSPYV